MEDKDKILDYTKLLKIPDDCSKTRKNFTQGYFYREIGKYKNAVPSQFQWAAEDKLINKNSFEELKCQLPDSPRSTFLMVFSPDGKKVASTHGNHNVYVTDLTTGKHIQTLSGHPRTPWCIAFHPSSNQILASGCLGGQVRVWDLHGGSEVWNAESQTVIASLAFHPVDRMLVIATYNELHFWDWSQPEPFAKCCTKSEREKVRYVSFDRLGNKLITGIANPVSVASQWDRINVVNTQSPSTSTTTASSFNSTPTTTVATSQVSTDQGRSITFCYRHLMNQYNQLVNRYFDLSRSRVTPTIDRGTDPMDLLDLRNSGPTTDNSASNPSTSTPDSQSNTSSPFRFHFSRLAFAYRPLVSTYRSSGSAHRNSASTHRPLSSRERFRIHSSIFSRLNSRSSMASSNFNVGTTTSTPTSETPTFTTSSSLSSSTTSPTLRLRRCALRLGPTTTSWCLSVGPEPSNSFFTRNTSQATSSSGAITNPTYTSYSDRGIFSTRESIPNRSEGSNFSVVQPHRLRLDEAHRSSVSDRNSAESSSNSVQRENIFNNDPSDRLTALRLNFNSDSSRSNAAATTNSNFNMERETSSSTLPSRRFTHDLTQSPHRSSVNEESNLLNDPSLPTRSSSRFHSSPVALRNDNTGRRFRRRNNFDEILLGSSRRQNRPLSPDLMRHRPVPRLHVRSRFQEQSQLHLLANRETHGLNLQNNQSLRRQLSFRPGGQYVLSRHSNSPFQPRIPHQLHNNPAQSESATNVRPEVSALRSSFITSLSSNVNSTEDTSSTSSSEGNTLSPRSLSNSNSISGYISSRRLREKIQRRLLIMMIKDSLRNSSEIPSPDSTVNYSRISGESEADDRSSLGAQEIRGLGPRGADPMLSSTSENHDTSSDTLILPDSTLPGSQNNSSLNANGINPSQNASDYLYAWESETDSAPFSLSSPLPLNDILSEQTQPQIPQESQESNVERVQQTETTSDNPLIHNSDTPFSEFNMRQGIQLLSRHIENMQRLCWARIEILQRQKIRGMWEDLTNQIRQFHNTIQNRTRENVSTQNDITNSSTDLPSIRNLAISSTPAVGSGSSNPSTSSNYSNLVNNYKELVESMVNEIFNDADLPSLRDLAISSSPTAENSSPSPSTSSSRTDRYNYKDLVESLVNEKLSEAIKSNKSATPETNFQSNIVTTENSQENTSKNSSAPTNETEEPQPGPSGLSTPNISQDLNHLRLKNENLNLRLSERFIEAFLKERRRRDARSVGPGTSSSFLRHSTPMKLRNSSRDRSRVHRHGRHILDSFASRSRALNGELEAILRTRKKEKVLPKVNEEASSCSSSANSVPRSSVKASTSSADACQSCGQKKKVTKELSRSKRRSLDSLGDLGSSGSASKASKSNAGERSEAPSGEERARDDGPSTSQPSSSSQESSTNELLKQMIQTMETMLRFLREAFCRTEDFGSGHSSRQQPTSVSSSEEDSDHDFNEQSERFIRNLPSNFRNTKEIIMNLMRDVTQIRAKKLLGFMVKSLTQFFGRNFENLVEVLDEQILSLYMLLHLALELTDLLLDQLNIRSRNLERAWQDDVSSTNFESRTRNLLRSSAAGRIRERSRNMTRNSYNPPYGAGRQDTHRYRLSSNPFLQSHTRPMSLAPSPSEHLGSSTFPRPSGSSYSRKKRATARMSTGGLSRYNRAHGKSSNISRSVLRTMSGSSLGGRRGFRFDRRTSGEEEARPGIRAFDYEINNNNNNSNDTNNNYHPSEDRNNNNNNIGVSTSNNNSSNSVNMNRYSGNSNDNNVNSSNNSSSSNFFNYYFSNNSSTNNSDNSNNNIIIVTGLNSNPDISNSTANDRSGSNEGNTPRQAGSNSFLSQSALTPLRSMELALSRNESGDLSLRDERPIFWIRYGSNGETSGTSNSNDSQSRVNTFTVPVVQVNDIPVSDVSMLNQPRHRPQSPLSRVPEDVWRWRAWRPRLLHPRYSGPNPFDDQDSNDVPENVDYYRILSTSAGSHLGVYTLDPMIVTEASLNTHHRIQAWDFSKMNIPDISDREANGVVPECKIHNDASVDVSKDGHLLVTLLPSGRLSVTTMLGVYSLDWSSLGQLLYRTSFEQNAVSVSLSPTNRHLLVGLASRPVVVRDRTNMAQIFRLEGGRPSPHGGSWQSGRGRLVHMRDLEQTRETNTMSLNCIRWAPGAGQGLVYGTNNGQLKVLR